MSLVGSYVALSKPLVRCFPSSCWPGCVLALVAWRCGAGCASQRTNRRSRRTRGLLFLESFLGNFLFSICMLFGVRLTTAVAAGVVMSAIPAVVAILSWLFLARTHRSPHGRGHRLRCAGHRTLLAAKARRQQRPSQRSKPGLHGLPLPVWGNLLVFRSRGVRSVVRGHRQAPDRRTGPKRISAIINLWGFALVTPMGLWAAWRFDFGTLSAPASGCCWCSTVWPPACGRCGSG